MQAHWSFVSWTGGPGAGNVQNPYLACLARVSAEEVMGRWGDGFQWANEISVPDTVGQCEQKKQPAQADPGLTVYGVRSTYVLVRTEYTTTIIACP